MEMMTETNTMPVSLKATQGEWTRINRNNTTERSIIDYIIIEQENETKTLNIIIDEECIYPIQNEDYRERDGTIKRSKQTDHNTITMIWDTTVQM